MRLSCHPFRPCGVSSPSPTEETGGLWVSRAAGLGFCEAQKGGRCIIARSFDHVSGNYWLGADRDLPSERIFSSYPSWQIDAAQRVGPARPLTLQSRAPWCLKVIDPAHWDSLASGGTRARFGNRVSPLGRSSWHSPPRPPGSTWPAIPDDDREGLRWVPPGSEPPLLRSGMSHPPLPTGPLEPLFLPAPPRPVLPDV